MAVVAIPHWADETTPADPVLATGAVSIDSVSGVVKVGDGSTAFSALAPVAPAGATAPSTAASTGVKGQIAFDATHIYVCIAANTWVRATTATW